VGHGDYSEALRIIGAGQPEPYFGMAYTLRVLDALFDDSPHLVISLTSPRYREQHAGGELVGLPMPQLPRIVPATLSLVLWGKLIVRELARFEPTHVLLRTAGIPAWKILRYCTRHRINTLAIFANLFDDADAKTRYVNRRVAKLLNDPCVFLVGNHKQPATDSMIAMGVDPRKSAAWDWPHQRDPAALPPKTLSPGAGAARIVYVGAISEQKGIGDLVDAVALLASRGRNVHLTVAGVGPDLDRVQLRARALPPGRLTFCGKVGNEEAFRLMVESTIVCVPSRHEFSEGMPLTLTEALASRTPCVVSDHPVLKRAFLDGEGVRFFRAQDASSLAAAIEDLLGDPGEYLVLSRSTEDAFRRVRCPTSFGDLVQRWHASF
jgi:glycosyltransferase involved in cell wall biosynthesis